VHFFNASLLPPFPHSLQHTPLWFLTKALVRRLCTDDDDDDDKKKNCAGGGGGGRNLLLQSRAEQRREEERRGEGEYCGRK